MEDIFGVKVRTEILSTRHGSLVIFFAAIFTGFNLVANYKSFHDSVLLLQRQGKRLVDSALDEQYGDDSYYSDIEIEYPLFPEREHRVSLQEQLRSLDFYNEIPDLITLPKQRRDGFFYFLLILSIISLAVIGLLVYGAVAKTYFP